MKCEKSFILSVFLFFLVTCNGVAMSSEAFTAPFHPPVTVNYEGKTSVLVFLKNNFKEQWTMEESKISDGEFFNLTHEGEKIEYVDSIKGEAILSVFFLTGEKTGKKYLYILTKSKHNEANKKGSVYSVDEYAITLFDNEVGFIPQSENNRQLPIMNCFEGVDNGKKVSCPYKNASSIKKFLKTIR